MHQHNHIISNDPDLLLGFDYLEFWVGNALQSATFFISRFGFQPLAYRGLETGSRNIVTHVVKQNNIVIAFSSPLSPNYEPMARFLSCHGDSVRDIAFTVNDCHAAFNYIVEHGGRVVMKPTEYRDENGTVIIAVIETFGDVVHSLIERKNYRGVFLPNFVPVQTDHDPLVHITPSPRLETIDHVVGNLAEGHLDRWAHWYKSVFDLQAIKEYSVDTKESSLRTIIVSNKSRSVKIPLLEPVRNVKKSQNQEYLEFNGGPGVQHIALLTSDIIHTVTQLRARGVKFQEVPPEYYTYIKKKLQKSNVQLKEDFDKLQELKILIDFDDATLNSNENDHNDNKNNHDKDQNDKQCQITDSHHIINEHSNGSEEKHHHHIQTGSSERTGYLLQIFTHLVQDRPTVFFEIIQRHHHDGFGEGNIRALFECVEREQAKRGNLVSTL